MLSVRNFNGITLFRDSIREFFREFGFQLESFFVNFKCQLESFFVNFKPFQKNIDIVNV